MFVDSVGRHHSKVRVYRKAADHGLEKKIADVLLDRGLSNLGCFLFLRVVELCDHLLSIGDGIGDTAGDHVLDVSQGDVGPVPGSLSGDVLADVDLKVFILFRRLRPLEKVVHFLVLQ